MVAQFRRMSGQTVLQLACRGVHGVCWQVHSIDVCLGSDHVLLFVDHICQWMDHLMEASCTEILVLYTRGIEHDAVPVLVLGMRWSLPSMQHFVCQNGFILTWEGNLHLVPSLWVTSLVGWFVGWLDSHSFSIHTGTLMTSCKPSLFVRYVGMYLDRLKHGVQCWVIAHKVPASCTMMFAQTVRHLDFQACLTWSASITGKKVCQRHIPRLSPPPEVGLSFINSYLVGLQWIMLTLSGGVLQLSGTSQICSHPFVALEVMYPGVLVTDD